MPAASSWCLVRSLSLTSVLVKPRTVGPVVIAVVVAGLSGQAGVVAQGGVEDREKDSEMVRSKNRGLCRACLAASIRNSRRRPGRPMWHAARFYGVRG